MSAPGGGRPFRVVVCGTTFGQVYLEGLHRAGPEIELAGVLGRGSERTALCARHYGVPAYDDPDDLPGDVDAACVVVRSGLLGGGGVQLAQRLMERGVHVLQEHPLHHDELAECLRVARRAGVVYHLNSFYPHVEPVRRFTAAARELMGGGRPAYVDAACGFQLAYSLLDILGGVLGGVRPWALADAPPPDDLRRVAADADLPFRSLDGVIAGVPWTLRVQNQLDPGDPDNHAHVDHRVTVGTEGGSLTLLATHGPIVVARRPQYPHAPRDPGSRPHFGAAADGAAPPSARVVGDHEAPDFARVFGEVWPPAVRRAVLELRDAVLTGRGVRQRAQYHLSLCLLWQDITARLGPPELIRRESPRALEAERLAAIAEAGAAMEVAG